MTSSKSRIESSIEGEKNTTRIVWKACLEQISQDVKSFRTENWVSLLLQTTHSDSKTKKAYPLLRLNSTQSNIGHYYKTDYSQRTVNRSCMKVCRRFLCLLETIVVLLAALSCWDRIAKNHHHSVDEELHLLEIWWSRPRNAIKWAKQHQYFSSRYNTRDNQEDQIRKKVKKCDLDSQVMIRLESPSSFQIKHSSKACSVKWLFSRCMTRFSTRVTLRKRMPRILDEKMIKDDNLIERNGSMKGDSAGNQGMAWLSRLSPQRKACKKKKHHHPP